MKKQVFLDKQQSVVIKVFPTSSQLERELHGIQAFQNLVLLPQMEKLDRRVAKISLLSGFLGYQILESNLNQLIAHLLVKPKSKPKITNFTIFEDLSHLKKVFANEPKTLQKINQIEKLCQTVPLVPVHGDLQKQNIIISEGQLGLIDFEHFTLAPQELELCNSLFYDDGNCLNIPAILKFLPKGSINIKILKCMLEFYALKQISLGLSQTQAALRLQQALDRLQSEQL